MMAASYMQFGPDRQYRSDLFEIDDIELYGKEYIKELK